MKVCFWIVFVEIHAVQYYTRNERAKFRAQFFRGPKSEVAQRMNCGNIWCFSKFDSFDWV